MKADPTFLKKLEKLLAQKGPYKTEAFEFVMAALSYTLKKLRKRRHVSGRELLHGIRDYGMEQFGLLTLQVFNYWGVQTTEDFGRIVFTLIDTGLMTKTENDTLDDFRDVYDLKKVFDRSAMTRLYEMPDS